MEDVEICVSITTLTAQRRSRVSLRTSIKIKLWLPLSTLPNSYRLAINALHRSHNNELLLLPWASSRCMLETEDFQVSKFPKERTIDSELAAFFWQKASFQGF